MIAWLVWLLWGCGSGPGAAEWAEAPRSMLGARDVAALFDPDPPSSGANVVWLHGDLPSPPTVEAIMLEMGAMPEMRAPAEVTSAGDDRWRARFLLPMGGSWTLIVRSGPDAARFGFTVGAPGLVGEGSVDAAPAAGESPGAVRIDAARRQQFNIRTEPVVRGLLSVEVRGSGSIVPVEGRTAAVALRVEGYARDVRVETGQLVRKGQILLSLYAPELIVAQQELRIAAGTGDKPLAEAARERLRRMDVADQEITAIEAGTSFEAVPIRSPVDGHVLEKDVVAGDPVEAGRPILVVAALDRVWVEAELYEPEASRIAPGAIAHVSFPESGGVDREGRVELLHPHLSPDARTRIVRIGLDNTDDRLVPGMWATVSIPVDLGDALLVPTSAVLYTGDRRIVFVDLGEGGLAPRDVMLGDRAGDRIAVLEGLAEGEEVVSSGTFLVAAESRIRSAAGLWSDDAGR